MGKVEVNGGPILWNGPKYVEWLIGNKIKESEKGLLFIKQNKEKNVN